ncbi:MAG: glutamate--tRNA ligase [Ignavibacteriales bacterium]|nr:glutamate--tRNA ligase [Ignavibacteriales bacterium]
MLSEKPRVRFAPSPTGYLHVGGLRTALYNYLYAKKNDGKFILRIEDTDKNRYVEGAMENLIETLKWIGLDYNEGPFINGNFGPYIQSQRLNIYRKYADELIEKGKAYHCFCTAERLENLRVEQKKLKLPQAMYDKHCLKLTQDEIKENLEKQIPHVIRLNVDKKGKVVFDDIIRDRVEFDCSTIDDQVLIKSDGYPTYHLANVIDDHLMKITHVIRGEEWLSSTPKHILLYDYFGWEKPIFAHLPLLLNPDKSKLSKRQGDVAVEDYRDKGYLKEAIINFIALLGWSGKDNKEFFMLDELIKEFSLEKVHKAGAVFNIEKLNWLNSEHIKNKSSEDILTLLKKEMINSKFKSENYSDFYLIKVIEIMKERITFIKDYITLSPYFFEKPEDYDKSVIDKRWESDTPEHLHKLIANYVKLEHLNKEQLEITLKNTAEELEIGTGKLIHPVRLAVSGIGVGPGLYEILEILGKDEVITRIKKAIEKIKQS